MHITVAGKQVETGEALKVHATEGLKNVARKYFDHALDAQVIFARNRSFFTCGITIHAGRGLTVRGEGEGPDAHRAFDVAAEHIAKRLRRYRRRVNEHSRHLAEERLPAEAETARQVILAGPVEEPEEEEEVSNLVEAHPEDGTVADGLTAKEHDDLLEKQDGGGAIIAETPTEISHLTVSEAVMRLDLGQMPVMMFRNRASGQLNVVYRRPDGHVGWIDTAAVAG
ncbi:ribosome hibernation-promoting factor, HPF/YfiA family [Roseomonas marmotae]|uniref:Ribosome hibernation promoting factor n=1 Tax=Roseomonas marmotae TaxID=2768161 RepID=A0ABS3KCB1_9PROT|nr:ribosome-associated translation inhibitor RaiA [Roseomonas marmotae]MBO1075118.1 ribosome-associated translation inhibitor RaiA [Roseomonas marmotae]QTI79767.1 ribosome-associated translation inhibitor RaiA [Roseomonas marmotae]